VLADVEQVGFFGFVELVEPAGDLVAGELALGGREKFGSGEASGGGGRDADEFGIDEGFDVVVEDEQAAGEAYHNEAEAGHEAEPGVELPETFAHGSGF